jgi:hypothetical protein
MRELIVKRHRDGTPPAVRADQTIFETQSAIAIAVALTAHVIQVPGDVPPAAAWADASFGCTPAAGSKALPLVVYYQIVQKEDRADRPEGGPGRSSRRRTGQIVQQEDRASASRIGFEIPEAFPSAGVEYVATADLPSNRPKCAFITRIRRPRPNGWPAC